MASRSGPKPRQPCWLIRGSNLISSNTTSRDLFPIVIPDERQSIPRRRTRSRHLPDLERYAGVSGAQGQMREWGIGRGLCFCYQKILFCSVAEDPQKMTETQVNLALVQSTPAQSEARSASTFASRRSMGRPNACCAVVKRGRECGAGGDREKTRNEQEFPAWIIIDYQILSRVKGFR